MTSDDALAHFGMEAPPRYDVPPLTLDDEQVRAELRAAFSTPHEPSEAEMRVEKLGRQVKHFLWRADDSNIECLLRIVVAAEQVFAALDLAMRKTVPRPWHLIGAKDADEVINRLLTSEAMRK